MGLDIWDVLVKGSKAEEGNGANERYDRAWHG
jgi:hypothetical protein